MTPAAGPPRSAAGPIGVVDYGAGNLRNVQAALNRLQAPWRSVAGPADLAGAGAVILPGVGRFGAAASRLREAGLFEALREFARSGRPFLGICAGMQLLFEASAEDPGLAGLGVLRGRIERLEAERLPHIGWAVVEAEAGGPAGALFAGLPARFYAYFAHSFACPPDHEAVAARTSCPPAFAAAVRAGMVFGTQFHPEKSGADGQALLGNFVRLAGVGDAAEEGEAGGAACGGGGVPGAAAGPGGGR